MYNFLITKIQIFIDNTNRKEKGSGSKAETPFHKISKCFIILWKCICLLYTQLITTAYLPRRAFSRSIYALIVVPLPGSNVG
ncbi:hypothetical protein IMSAG025_01954 [Muribaculaceae bacterium]|nr:hypothetical protein IMSAG025_01954 [Muribaculaceae bacterium]